MTSQYNGEHNNNQNEHKSFNQKHITDQRNGQRIYGGPPEGWAGPAPSRGCEVYVTRIPRDCFENELVPIFSKIGPVYEHRLMMEHTGANRGYGYVRFTNTEDAKEAIKALNNYEIRPGRFLVVTKSVDNRRLWVNGIPKNRSGLEIRGEMERLTSGVRDIILYPSQADKTKSRGYMFVEYESHRAAALARKKLVQGSVFLFGQEIGQVDWAEPEHEVDEETMSTVKILFVRNLMLSTTSASAYGCTDVHKGPCKRTSQCEPVVMPKNTTHLVVEWENFLEESCEQKYIEDIKIVVMEESSNKNTKTVPANMKSTTVEADPCKSHLVIVKFDFTQDYNNNHGRSRVQSPNFKYNKIVDNEFLDPFGGLLTTEVLPRVCLKKNGTIQIPKAPAALAKCDVQSGDVEDPDFQEVGTTANVKIAFKHPHQPGHETYQMFEVSNIKACPESVNNINNNVVIGLVVGSCILLLVLVSLAFVACWKRQKKTKSKNIKKEVDVNPVYGIYALNEEGEDISVTEVRDTNDYYFK